MKKMREVLLDKQIIQMCAYIAVIDQNQVYSSSYVPLFFTYYVFAVIIAGLALKMSVSQLVSHHHWLDISVMTMSSKE